MNAAIAKDWVNALRSGEYKQQTGTLATDDLNGNSKFCCLGVLCDMYVKTHPEAECEVGIRMRPVPGTGHSIGIVDYFGDSCFLPQSVQLWADVSQPLQEELAELNDNGCTFTDIAAAIEAKLPKGQ